ncbi:Os06g0705400 [Oryza sativa Japonica Group]|uniref:Uncharacterized protein n=3 Tax=Oryza sativa TaxID=4530 RepID=A0A8J8YKS6_ORYSJ|nr:hypothetical protein OsI_24393 [Oryza sativa Indica Group]EEE66329.1 hypothetical protein OsJ_22570 [Oryza sativa Japonica Group]BAS99398.1 Os06g0705400 [Oryza sativa Japonica Group]
MAGINRKGGAAAAYAVALCQYARDPSYRSYVTSPSAQRAVKACNVKANC